MMYVHTYVPIHVKREKTRLSPWWTFMFKKFMKEMCCFCSPTATLGKATRQQDEGFGKGSAGGWVGSDPLRAGERVLRSSSLRCRGHRGKVGNSWVCPQKPLNVFCTQSWGLVQNETFRDAP